MLRLIMDKAEIEKAQKTFENKMNASAEKRGKVWVGYQGGIDELNVLWSSVLDVWWTMLNETNRYWNAFGTGEPKWDSKYSHSIICEINVPFAGINRTIAGAYARDNEWNIYLVHRGKIGGGKKDIGKLRFMQHFRGEWEKVDDGSVIEELALVGSLNSLRFPNQIADFIHEVRRIKNLPTVTEKPKPAITTFKEEFFGIKRFGATSKEIQAKCDHGIIVNTLAKMLESKKLAVGNNAYMDLYVLDGQDIRTLFEIKTDSSLTKCYECVGQLLFHSSALDKKPRLVAVFPHPFNKQYEDVLRKLNIDCLTYTWSNNRPIFRGDIMRFVDLKEE